MHRSEKDATVGQALRAHETTSGAEDMDRWRYHVPDINESVRGNGQGARVEHISGRVAPPAVAAPGGPRRIVSLHPGVPGIEDVEQSVGGEGQSPREIELTGLRPRAPPGSQPGAVSIEASDAMIEGVADEQPARRVEGHRGRVVELAVAEPVTGDLVDVPPGTVEDLNSTVAAIGDVEKAVASKGQAGGSIEMVCFDPAEPMTLSTRPPEPIPHDPVLEGLHLEPIALGVEEGVTVPSGHHQIRTTDDAATAKRRREHRGPTSRQLQESSSVQHLAPSRIIHQYRGALALSIATPGPLGPERPR